MLEVRRTAYAFVYLKDTVVLNLGDLLSDRASEADARLVALSLLTGAQHELSPAALKLLMVIPAGRWVPQSDYHDVESLSELFASGLVISTGPDATLTALRQRDEALAANEWNLYGALYHFMTRWSGVRYEEGEQDAEALSAQSRAVARRHVREHGLPPPAVPEQGEYQQIPLPRCERPDDLYAALMARKTTRAFDALTPMGLDELATVLWYVFGCHGYAQNAAEITCVKRTSPSGGGLHPVEAYPLISNVVGVQPGLYHYDGQEHALQLRESLTKTAAQALATCFMCGQGYFGSAHVCFVLTARFYRSHWKYRRHQKAYAGMLMDAAHLSQTLYLVSAELDLGAFVTLAINGRDIDERLGLDGVSEGVIAMTGCGRRASGASPLELQFSEARPGRNADYCP